MPSSKKSTPTMRIHWVVAPVPVKARFEDAAVAAGVVVAEPDPPDPPEPAVVVVELGLVGVEPPPATAMIGFMFAPDGAVVVMPEVATVSFLKVVQLRASGLPPITSVRPLVEASWIVIPVLVAVYGPTVSGLAGRSRATPVDGTGTGRVTLKLKGPSALLAGVAPLARTVAVAEPVSVGWMASAAPAKELGRFTSVW
jgi:hypothetical protein